PSADHPTCQARPAEGTLIDAMADKTHPSTAQKRRLLGAAVLLGGLAVAVALLPVGEWLQTTLRWAEQNRQVSWLVYVALYIFASVIAFPTWLLTVAGGYLFGMVGGMAAAAAGALAGATATFLIARTVAYDWVHGRFASSPKFAAIDRAIGSRALLIVTLTRLSLVIPYNVLNYMFGLTAVSLRHYIIGTFIGMLPVLALYVGVGRGARNLDAIFAGDIDTGAEGRLLMAAGLAFAIAVVVVITRIATQTLRKELGAPPP
ncbi:MAG: VTT domain-containing protein, partial [Pseudomonadota bacterium]